MGFKEEVLSQFMDEEGLVTIDRNPTPRSTGNGLLFTGLFYTLLHKMREATAEDVARFSRTVDGCWEGPYGDARYVGLLERNDGREDAEAQDDYYGVVAASFHLGTEHASQIHDFGYLHWWCFDNVDPGSLTPRFCHLRFPGLVGLYKAAVKPHHPGFLHNHLIAGKILTNAYSSKDDIDGKIMTLLMISVLEQIDYCALVGDAMNVWKKQFRKNYGTIGRMVAPYFDKPSNSFDHPFSKLELSL